MVITQDILTVYAALAEHIYRRDSQNDQALNISDIANVLGLDELDVTNAETNPVSVTDQDANPLVSWTDSEGESHTDLAANGNYYYSGLNRDSILFRRDCPPRPPVPAPLRPGHEAARIWSRSLAGRRFSRPVRRWPGD